MQNLTNSINLLKTQVDTIKLEFEAKIKDSNISLFDRLRFFKEAPDYLKNNYSSISSLPSQELQDYVSLVFEGSNYNRSETIELISATSYNWIMVLEEIDRLQLIDKAKFDAFYLGEFSFDEYLSTQEAFESMLQFNVGQVAIDW